MKWFRRTLCESRIFILAFLAVELFYMVDGRNYVYAHQVYEQKEARLKEISVLLDIPVEKLRPDHESLFDSLRNLFGKEKDPVKEAGLKRLRVALKKHEEELAANPYLPQIEAVKREHAVYRIEGVLNDLMQLTEPQGGKALPEASQRALLRNLHYALQEDLTLPVPEGLPAKAQAKLATFQAKLDRLIESVRPIVAETQSPNMTGTLGQKIRALRTLQAVETKRSGRPPRFVDRPLPLRRVERKARTVEASSAESEAATKGSSRASAPSEPPRVVSKAGIAPEIVELAESLDNSPARIFTWVHDHIDFDPKWGAYKGPLGTLWEKSGTSWDQAWLLRDLLVAAGVDARFEWGEIEISAELLTNITGLDDPFRAGDLMTTAGVPIVLLTEGSRVVKARMSHVWVEAFVDYIPNRGATPGPGDKWIRMDPSLKRFNYAEGLRVAEQVPFALSDYLQSGTPLSPRRAYEEDLWAYIRANDINCTTLEQLKPSGSISAENFPFLPGTLRGKILRVDGEAADIPNTFQQRLRVEVRTAGGISLLDWEAALPTIVNQRLELDWNGATADDQATLDANGGVFTTPPYLVDLKPVIRVGGVVQASGGAIGSAEEVEVFVTSTPANGPVDVLVHEGYSGEPSVIVTDFGHLSRALLSRIQEAQLAASASGDAAMEERATLQLIGATYMHDLGRDLEDLTSWSWHRLVRLLTEGMVVQSGKVTVAVDGSPLSFTREEVFVDIAAMIVGLFHAEGATEFRRGALELAGAQGSFLEGEVFNQVIEQEGIAAVSALTLAQRQGQSLSRVDASNVDGVLAAVDLGADVEDQVRSAVANGRIAWVSEMQVDVNQWRGVGFVLEDPSTGAAGYLLAGGFAGGADTGKALDELRSALGDEAWLGDGIIGSLVQLLLELVGGANSDPDTNQSDPVNLSSGNMWFSETDLTIQARGLPITWIRVYNSRSSFSGPLGHGWTFTYGEQLEEQPDGSMLYRELDGTEHTFTSDGAGGYTAPPGKHLTLSTDGSDFVLRSKRGLQSTFDSGGRLRLLADTNGNTVALAYDGLGNPASITDAAGRQVLTVTTVDGKITMLTDLVGRTVVFVYDGDDLVSVTDPGGNTSTYSYDVGHKLVGRSDPLDHTDSYSYDILGRCVRHVNPLGNVETFHYSSRGSRAVSTDRRGFERVFEFDERGRAVVEVDPLGSVSRSTWDDDNNRTSSTDARGGDTVRTFDDQGNMLSETNPLGETVTYTYDPVFNQVVTATDPSGHTVTNVYNTNGDLQETTEVVGGETLTESYTYDAFGQLETHTDANGNVTSFVIDAIKGTPESQTDSLGQTTQITTDGLGRVTAVTNPGNDTVGVSWDDLDRPTNIIDPFGNTTSATYDAAGRLTVLSTPRGTTTLEYDAAGQPVATIDALGNVTREEFDPGGNRTGRIDAEGNRTTATYDAVGRLIAVVDALGNTWSFGYCSDIGAVGASCSSCTPGADSGAPGTGSFCELTDPLGNVTRQDHDALGRVVRIADPLGHETVIAYDERGQRESVTDALGRTTSYEYDERGRLRAVVEANGARTEYAYDNIGNLLTTKDAEGRDWTRTYDELNRLKTDSDPLGNITQLSYDSVGNLERKLRPNGQETEFDYSAQRLTAIHLPGGAVESFEYDEAGRRVVMSNAEVSLSYVYDELNRLTRMTNNSLAQSIEYEYDANGALARMSGPSGLVEYFYDGLNRLVEQRDAVTGLYRYEYDSLGRRTKLYYPNGLVVEYSYDAASRLESVITKDQQGQVRDGYSYIYDPVGNRTSMTALQGGVVNTYEYDEVYRLTRWDRGEDRFEMYDYDLAGNRKMLTDEAGTTTYTYDSANRLTSTLRELGGGGSTTMSYAWNPNGNLTSKTVGSLTTTYQWDALDRMVQLSGPAGVYSYGYDPLGIRVRETNNGETRRLLLSQRWVPAPDGGIPEDPRIGRDGLSVAEIVGEFDEDGNQTAYYSHGPRVDEPLGQVTDSGVHYLHRDGLGSVTSLSSTDGGMNAARSYSAFGEVEVASGVDSRYGFTSRESDPTGLMYYRARYFQPDIGRFVSRDSFLGTLTLPSSLNRYSYTENNPVSFTDPTGYFTAGLFVPFMRVMGFVFLLIGCRLIFLTALAYQYGDWEVGFFIGILGLAYFITGYVLLQRFLVGPLKIKNKVLRKITAAILSPFVPRNALLFSFLFSCFGFYSALFFQKIVTGRLPNTLVTILIGLGVAITCFGLVALAPFLRPPRFPV